MTRQRDHEFIQFLRGYEFRRLLQKVTRERERSLGSRDCGWRLAGNGHNCCQTTDSLITVKLLPNRGDLSTNLIF